MLEALPTGLEPTHRRVYRTLVPPMDSPEPSRAIVLFDGVCNFCSDSVDFIIRRDPMDHFRFASLQSDAGQRLLRRHGIEPGDLNTIVLLEHGTVYTQSTAAIQISRRLV